MGAILQSRGAILLGGYFTAQNLMVKTVGTKWPIISKIGTVGHNTGQHAY